MTVQDQLLDIRVQVSTQLFVVNYAAMESTTQQESIQSSAMTEI